jgi:hypothetical protein
MTVSKIVSGGQSGVDRAALDVAIQIGIPHGGWVPKGRKAEDGVIPEKYKVTEMETKSYALRTEQNVIDSDGTLIISQEALTEGSELTRQFAIKYERPWLHINLRVNSAFEGAKSVNYWILQNNIRVLNVAGPRSSHDANIYDAAAKLLKAVFYLGIMQDDRHEPYRNALSLPRTVNEAVDRLISELALKDRMHITRMQQDELISLQPLLGGYIGRKFGLGTGNWELYQSCQVLAGNADLEEEDAALLIIRALWNKLAQTHRLRLVK